MNQNNRSMHPLNQNHEQAKSDKYNDVLAQLSVELRTPISVIKMTIEAIEDGMFENNEHAFLRLHEKFAELETLLNQLVGKE